MISRTTLEENERGMIMNKEREMDRNEAKGYIPRTKSPLKQDLKEKFIDWIYDNELEITEKSKVPKETKAYYKLDDPLNERSACDRRTLDVFNSCIHCKIQLPDNTKNPIWPCYSFRLCEKCEKLVLNTILYDYYGQVLEEKNKVDK